MNKRVSILLNVRFEAGQVICAKSVDLCRQCNLRKNCETIKMFYYPYDDLREVMKARKYRRNKHGCIEEIN